jgi:hypothetical protein
VSNVNGREVSNVISAAFFSMREKITMLACKQKSDIILSMTDFSGGQWEYDVQSGDSVGSL